VARQEWDALHPGEEPPSGLVVREPQVRQAKAELDAALADLDVARLNLERTRLSLPFDGVVVSKQVDVGQFVTTGSPLANVYGTEVVEVRVPLENRELAWFTVPNGNKNTAPVARIEVSFAGEIHTWAGRVARIAAEIDPVSRMVPVVIEIANPFAQLDGKPPLMPGSFVDVEISGRTLEGVIPVPRHAVRENSTVWVFDDGVLDIRSVELARSDREHALIQSGVEPGEEIVVSSLDAVTHGMKVRTSAESNENQGGAA
jgi:RND family efflux transporter MFP subunit